VWFTILSSAPHKQGYVTASEENDYMAKMHAVPTAALLDPTGEIGHLYDAKTSPQMFVISPQGVLIYDGAVDDKPTTSTTFLARRITSILRLSRPWLGSRCRPP